MGLIYSPVLRRRIEVGQSPESFGKAGSQIGRMNGGLTMAGNQ
jgi:hypothetical protein